jgi:glyoxylase-like metal-dependent hydrolase (beta-lactamase superfamily II)
MKNNYFITLIVLVLLINLGLVGKGFAQDEPQRVIGQITDGLYRAQNGNHVTLFYVTSEGIIVMDPILPGFSSWLKAELATRFDVPVKYVVYSHHHGDHASGGAVFADTARFVGHENMQSYLDMPPETTALTDVIGQFAYVAAMDTDGNGHVEREEAGELTDELFSRFDEDENNSLNGAEVYRGPVALVHEPEITYADELEITLGGKRVRMNWTGEMNHSFDLSIISFPDEKALFLVDFVTFKRLPYREMDYELGMYDEWKAAILMAEKLAKNYDHVITGHGPTGTWEDVTLWREYFEDLEAVVTAGIADGRSLEYMRANIELPAYSGWSGYNWLHENVLAMYHFLTD